MKILITTSGVGSRLGEMTKYTNKSLIRVGNKFVINYIIDLYKNINNVEFLITLGYYGDLVQQYLKLAYPDIKFIYIQIDKYKGEGSSLVYSLLQCKEYVNDTFIYSCCDTIIDDDLDFNFNENTLFLANKNDSSKYASVINDKTYINKINNKGAKIFNNVYIGVAYIKEYKAFFDCLEVIYNKNRLNKQLSDINVYQLMMERNFKFKYKVIEKYFDMGSIDTYKESCDYFKSDFNVLIKYEESISFMKDKVVKFFYSKSKNKSRVARSKILESIVPKINGITDNFYSMDLIKSKPLSEIYDGNIIYKLLNWAKANLWKKIDNTDGFKDICMKFYKDKSYNRINLGLENKTVKDYNIVNGLRIGSIHDLLEKVDFNYLSDSEPTHFHGDFILDNILYENNEKFVLIDWRENFGGDLERGDVYYDLGKLRHNIFFNHKNIEDNLFSINEIDSEKVEVDMKTNFFLINQLNDFDKFVRENNYDLRKIKIINSLIWLNMSPLHEYPLSNFLFNLGKYNLHLNLQN
jgi:NDP-sugar pyrophosphorylase family protein